MAIATALFVTCGAAAQVTPQGHNLDGVWLTVPENGMFTGRIIDGHPEPVAPAQGGPIPMQPWNAAMHAAWFFDQAMGASNGQRCLYDGTLKNLRGFDPFRIIETDAQVTILFEEYNRFDIFRFADKHPADLKPTWMGDAIAHWDGDTLVVDVTGFNGKVPLPHAVYTTTQLHLVHRLRLLPGGMQMEDRVTIDDPGAFTKSFDIVMKFDRQPDDTKLRDYQCAENNQNLPKPMPFWPVDWGPG